ncbi:unnamed protein product [Moneuplotes crassus]|uniref:Uncharacterized protein n=1 Tax=Euplotes crassus TaxID=5936 RepID=A0AAD1Y3T7_EUPCR|nr:unnamed protein product [Moneuplotes crassus]
MSGDISMFFFSFFHSLVHIIDIPYDIPDFFFGVSSFDSPTVLVEKLSSSLIQTVVLTIAQFLRGMLTVPQTQAGSSVFLK